MPNRLSTILRDDRGNFAMVSAVLAVPLVLAVGTLLDLSTIAKTRSELQNAIDAAALAVAREGKDVTNSAAAAIANDFLRENFSQKFAGLKVERIGTQFTVTANAKAKMAFGGLLGYSDWTVDALATADLAYATYEVGLVLDTTGSMAGGKLSSMKDAVIGLIDTMSSQVAEEDKLKFAMVPFATFVNVGPGFGPTFDSNGKQRPGTGAAWLDLAGKASFPQVELDVGASRFQLYNNLGTTWPGCVETRYGGVLDVDDTTPDASKPSTLFVPAFGIDEPDTGGYSNSYIKSDAKPKDKNVAEVKKRWNKYGVATDAAGKPLLGGLLDPVLAIVFGSTSSIPIDTSISGGSKKGPQRGCDMQPLTPLTSDYEMLKKNVSALVASGTTNIMEGVSWGHRVLSPGEPFTETKSKSIDVDQIMIVLTDGSNVLGNNKTDLGSSYSSLGYLTDGRLGVSSGGTTVTNSLMNDRTLAACEDAKAAGIEIYTIRLEEPNVATGEMLKKCASSEDHYFDVPSRSQLDEAFAKIGKTAIRLRLAS